MPDVRDDDRLTVGFVARPHGVRGELRVQLHAPGSTSLYDVKRVWFGGREMTIDSVRPTAGAVLVKLVGIDDRDAAQLLASKPVEVLRAEVPLAADEYLVGDLVGCDVSDTTGAALGKIVEIMHGSQDLLVIHDATHERILPLVPVFVIEVDTAARRVVVDPPEGLPVELIQAAKPPRPPRPPRPPAK